MTQLLITPADIVANTPLDTISGDRLIPSIKLAQEKYLRNDLGKALYDEIITDLAAGNENANNLALRRNFIKPAMIWLAMAEFLTYNRFRFDDKGNYAINAENSVIMTDEQNGRIVREVRINAQTYLEQLIDELCYNSELYPNYYRTTDGGPYPSFYAFEAGWYL